MNRIVCYLVCAVLSDFGLSALAKSEPEKIRIGLVFDLTGNRIPALKVINGIEFGLKNATVHGKAIELVRYDSKSDAVGTKTAMEELLKNPPDIIIAEIDSSKAFVAADMAEKTKRVMITPYATAPEITKEKKYVFRACFSDQEQGRQLAKFARNDLHANSSVIFYDGTQLYTKTLTEAFKASFTELGGKVLHEESIEPKLTSFAPELDRARALKPDIVFLPTYERMGARFMNEGMIRGFNFTYLGGDAWGMTDSFRDLVFGKQTPINAYWVSHYSGDFSEPKLAAVSRSYEATYKQPLTSSGVLGYDTAKVVLAVLEQARLGADQDDIRDAFQKINTIKGLSGAIRYQNAQEPLKSVFIRKVDGSTIGLVKEMKP